MKLETAISKRWVTALNEETRASRRLNSLAVIALFLALVFEVCVRTRGFTYDEPFHLSNVMLLKQAGFSVEFLKGTEYSAPGPLYPLLHFLLAPLTQLHPVRTRLVNVGFLAILLLLLYKILAHGAGMTKQDGLANQERCFCLALGFLAVPPAWIVSGLALTEVPCLAALCLGSWCWIKAREQQRWQFRWWACSIGAGVGLAASCWGRSILIGVVLALVVVDLFERPVAEVLPMALPALLLPGILFAIWGGLMPPQIRGVGGLSLEHLVLCLCYCGVFLFFLNLEWLRGMGPRQLPTAFCAGVVNFLFGLLKRHPYVGLNYRDLFPGAQEMVDRVVGSVLVIFAALYGMWLVRQIWAAYAERRFVTLYFGMGALVISLSPVVISNRWNIRYPVLALPFLLILASPGAKLGWARFALTVLGGILGFAFLNSYMGIHLKEAAPIVIAW